MSWSPNKWKPRSPLSDEVADCAIALWRKWLGLNEWNVVRERISRFQVCDHLCRPGLSFVGITADHTRRVATVHHTRRLTVEDIVHELMHIAFPSDSEAEVVWKTERVLKTRKEVDHAGHNKFLRRKNTGEDRSASRSSQQDPVAFGQRQYPLCGKDRTRRPKVAAFR
jgi:hypothetical protein